MEGHWTQVEGFDNMEGILDAVGVSDPQMRQIILNIRPEIELTKENGKWTYKLITPHSTRIVTFTSGDTIDYVSITGQPVKAQMTIEDNKLTEVHSDPNNSKTETLITREFFNDEMITTFKVNDSTAVGKYKKA